MLASLVSLLTLATLALAAFGVGRSALAALKLDEEDALGAMVWSTALGLVLCGTLLAWLGLAGWLHEGVVGVLTLAAAFWGLGEALRVYVDIRDGVTPAIAPDDHSPWAFAPVPPWLAGGATVAAMIVLCGSLTSALAPPTAGDALCYHLELPKRFLLEHRLAFLADSDNSTYPLLAEMWYAWALVLEGGVAAQLVHWLAGAMLALATVVLATPIIGRPWGWMAGAVVLLVPAVSNEMTAPLNDLALALFTTLTLAAWRRSAEEEDPRWLLVAGAMLAGALATKYLALVFALALAAVVGWTAWRRRGQRWPLVQGLCTIGVVAASLGGLWYVRAAWYRGNPVYPFFEEVAAGDGDFQTLPAAKSPLGRSPAALAAAPWQLTMHPERFGGRGFQLGPLFLIGLPVLWTARRLRGAGTLLAAAGVYGIGWFLLRQNLRFLLPVVPLLAVPLAWAAAELRQWPRAPRAVLAALAISVLAASAALPLWRARDHWRVALGWEARASYLLRREPTFRAAEAADLLGRELHILSQDHRAFYLPGRVTREHLYRRRTGYDHAIASPADASRVLLDAGFTHVLLAEPANGVGPAIDPTLSRLIDAQRAACGDERLTAMADYTFLDADGARRRYRLFMLR